MSKPSKPSQLVDTYIAKARPFAQPVLVHIRALVHEACPEAVEAMKWSRPFFEYKGSILANMSAFKEHCSFGFWGQEMGEVLKKEGLLQPDAMGSLGRITRVEDLPPKKKMVALIRQAATFIDEGNQSSPMSGRQRVAKAPAATEVPDDFAEALKKSQSASAAFSAFSPSCRREYISWIVEAKRPETRQKRIATAVEWIGEGKQRNWKYETR